MCYRLVLLLLLVIASGSTVLNVWPQPSQVKISSGSTVKLAIDFHFVVVGKSNAILQDAIVRYTQRMGALIRTSDSVHAGAELQTLSVRINSASSAFDTFVDESYTLTVNHASANLSAPFVWGAMRGLETFLQLVYHSTNEQIASVLSIQDRPRYSYRGLMIDTARHFYPIPFIVHIMDAMEANKMNFLHIHFTDDQSFPVMSTSYPRLTTEGAFGKQYIYNHTALRYLVKEATKRGIHIVPEFDMPAHSASWGAGYPGIEVRTKECSPRPFTHGDSLNPTNPDTFEVIGSFLREMIDIFPPPFLHLGGDEVPVTCWTSNATVVAWMKSHNIKTFGELESYFVNTVATNKHIANRTQNLMYWEEVFLNGVKLPKGSLIEAWKSNVIPSVIKAGHSVINSYKWYLNHGCDNYGDGVWNKFYENDPEKWAPKATPAELKRIIGGETAMWSECVDSVIFDAIVWLRTSAAAEMLWSAKDFTKLGPTLDVAKRLSAHRCMMLRRGVAMAPPDDSSYPRDLNQGCQ